MEPQAQAQQSPSVSEQAGEGAGVHADPLCSATPAPRFLHTPEEVDAYQLEAQVQEESQGEEEKGGENIRTQAGLEDLPSPAEVFSHQNTWKMLKQLEHFITQCKSFVVFFTKKSTVTGFYNIF